MEKEPISPKKQKILEAAAQLFRDKGYSATSMRDLARAVDLKASSLYNHIASKEEILQELCFSTAHKFVDAITEIELREEPALDKIKALIHLHTMVAATDLTSITSFNDEWRHLKEPHLSEFLSLRRHYEEHFLKILTAGMQAGSIKPMEPQLVFYTMLSSIRWLYDWRLRKQSSISSLHSEQISTILLSGLLVPEK